MRPGFCAFGAQVVGTERTRFRFWAPDCAEVWVEIEGAQPVAMRLGDDGIWQTEAACGAGTRYRYCLSPDLSVPDPASRAQSGDVHDWSLVVDQDRYAWRAGAWTGRPWHEAIVYELHAGTWGGFKAIERDLPRLAALGITAVELMPIADFPGRHNWGYDGVLPYAPDAAYGTPDELKAMIDAAHGLGLMVFLDVVYNHFGPDGNYLGNYASGFFREDVKTPWGGAIDFRKREVRRFFTENAIYWLEEFRFDGLRFDAVHAIADETFLPELAQEIRRTAENNRHVHLILENEKNQAELLGPGKFDAQWNDDWHHCLHVLLTGESEGYYADFQDPAAQLARAMKEGFVYQGEVSPHSGKNRGTPSTGLAPGCFVIFLQNHDQIGNRAMGDRLSALADPRALAAATLLLLASPQIPMIFMGEEWGEMRPFLFFTDHNAQLAEAVRNGRREEFAHFAAFSDPDTRARIPDPNDPATFAASVPRAPAIPGPEQAERGALFEQALRIRRDVIMPRLPGTAGIAASALSKAAVAASWRLGDGSVLTIAANFAENPVEFVPAPGRLLIETGDPAFQPDAIGPYACRVWWQAA